MKSSVAKIFFPVVLVVAALGAPLRAQASAFVYEAVVAAPVGSWAEYSMSFDGKPGPKQKMVLVERTARRLVIEIETAMTIGTSLIHLDYVPMASSGWTLSAGTMRMPNGQTVPLPSTAADDYRIENGRAVGERVGQETITTPMGAMICTHWIKAGKLGAQDVVTHIWTSDELFPIGLVKSTIESKKMVVLLSTVGRK